jgi:hypothetical protein
MAKDIEDCFNIFNVTNYELFFEMGSTYYKLESINYVNNFMYFCDDVNSLCKYYDFWINNQCVFTIKSVMLFCCSGVKDANKILLTYIIFSQVMCIPKDAYAAFDQKEHFCSVLWD